MMCSNVRKYTGFSIHIFVIYCLVIKQFSFGLTFSDLYPYGPNNGDRETARLDDGGSGKINLNSTFKFFGTNYTKLYVNNNGILTFDSELKVYKPQAFPPATESENHPIIAPFWADVDIQRNPDGSVYYRQTNNATLLSRASQEIRNYFIAQRLFSATWMFIVTWEDVGFYGAANPYGKLKKNTFQAILVTNGKRSFAIFNYYKIVWTTGSNSQGDTQTGLGGKQAQAGFNAGDGRNYYSIEGAQTAAVVNFTLTSNVGVPGKWVFRVDGKSVEDVKCHHAVQIKLHPQSASMLGGQEIRVSGPCFSLDFSVYARISETNITFPCTVQNDVTVSCVTPTIFRTGEVTFQLNPYNLGWNYSSVFSLVNIEEMVPRINVDINKRVTWNPDDIPSNDSKIELFQYKVDSNGQPALISVRNDSLSNANNGMDISIPRVTTSWSTALLRISWNSSANSNSLPVSIWSSPFPVSVDRDYSKQWCKMWAELENEKENLTDIFNSCPCTLNQALWDTGRFHTDSFCNTGKDTYSNCLYRRGASHCVHQNLRSHTTTGVTCCYDISRDLIDIRDNYGGGYRSRYHYRAQGNHIVPYFSYFEEDKLPYFHCCQNSEDRNLCLLFTKYRPPSTCQSYNPPTPAQAAGDPHITTLDGRDYTFNGVGDFVLVQDINSTVVIQVRTEQAKDTKGVTQNASIFSGVAIAAMGFSDIVKVHRPGDDDDAGVSIIVNGQKYDMDTNSVSLNGITLYKEVVNSTITLRLVLESVAVSLSVDVLPELLNLVVMVGDDNLKGKLKGLLGDFDGDRKNDFISRNGTHFPSNASMETIHYDFGMTWEVSPSENLFSDSLRETQSDTSQNIVNYVPVFVDKIDNSDLRNGTLELCGTVVQCKFDYQVTGNRELAKSTLKAVEKFNLIQENIKKVIRCPFVAAPENGNKSVTGYSPGDNATFMCFDDFVMLQGDKLRYCLEDGSWSGDETICAEPIVPPVIETKTLVYIGIGTGSGVAIILFITICLVICIKCKKKEPPSEEESQMDLPTIFPPSNIPCPVFENEAFMNSLQQLSAGGAFKIPRPSYVDPTIFDEYFF